MCFWLLFVQYGSVQQLMGLAINPRLCVWMNVLSITLKNLLKEIGIILWHRHMCYKTEWKYQGVNSRQCWIIMSEEKKKKNDILQFFEDRLHECLWMLLGLLENLPKIQECASLKYWRFISAEFLGLRNVLHIWVCLGHPYLYSLLTLW